MSQPQRKTPSDRFTCAGRIPELEAGARAQDQRETSQELALGRNIEKRVVEPQEGNARVDLALDDGREAEAAVGGPRRRGAHAEHRAGELEVRGLAEPLEERDQQLQRRLERG